MASPSGPTRDDLDKLLFRLVMAEDSRIEGLIRLHLPMLMDLMSTTSDEGIRNKVVECCSHLLKRLRADNKLQVPCDVLLEKARSPVNGAFTKNFALVFLEIGCPRLPAEAKNALGWALLVGLSAEGTADEAKPFGRHQVALVHCFLETVAFLRPGTGASFTATQASASSMTAPSSGTRSPVREDAGQTPLGSRVSECTPPHPSAQDMAFLRELFLDILLVPNASRLLPSAPDSAPSVPPPGLSPDALHRISSHPSLWSPGSPSGNPQVTLALMKLEVLRLLHSSLFTFSSSLPLLLLATCDSETRVKERAETLLKLQTDARAANKLPLSPDQFDAEDKRLAGYLLRLFLGGRDAGASFPAGPRRSRLGAVMRIKLLDWAMQECPEALIAETSLCLQVAVGTLTASQEEVPVKALGARLAAFVVVRCPPAPFALAGPLLLTAAKKVLVGCYQGLLLARGRGGGAADVEAGLREGCYEALAGLGHRMGRRAPAAHPSPPGPAPPSSSQAHLLFSDPLLLRLLFEALSLEPPVLAVKVAEALGAFRHAYSPAHRHLGRPPLDLAQFLPLLSTAAASPHPRARLAAVEWARVALPVATVWPRCMCLHLLDDPALEVRKAAAVALAVPGCVSAPGEEEDVPLYPKPEGLTGRGPVEAATAEPGDPGPGGLATGPTALPPFPALVAALLSPEEGPAHFPISRMEVRGQARALHFLYLSLLAALPRPLPPPSLYPPDVEQALPPLLSWILSQGLGDPVLAPQGPRRLLYRSASAFLAALPPLLPPALLDSLVTTELSLPFLYGWVAHEDPDVSANLGRLMGLACPRMPILKRKTALFALTAMLDKALGRRDARGARGPLLAIGEMIAATSVAPRLGAEERQAPSSPPSYPPASPLASDQDHSEATAIVLAASAVARAARHPQNEIFAAACLSLGCMGRAAPLPLLPSPSALSSSPSPAGESVPGVLRSLLTEVRQAGGGAGKERRGEAAAACLAALAAGGASSLPLRKEAVDACLAMGAVRDDEYQFAVGQALAALALGGDVGVFASVWEGVVEGKVRDNSPHVRAAATLWLLVLLWEAAAASDREGDMAREVQVEESHDATGAQSGAVQASDASIPAAQTETDTAALLSLPRLLEAQQVLVTLLRDKSELGQEASGKALGVLCSLAGHGPQVSSSTIPSTAPSPSTALQELTNALVLLLRGPSATANPTHLELNTPSSQLPPIQTNMDVGTLNPFRELCAMATDLGQPQLLYYFLALPSTHPSWAGRRAGLFAKGTPGPAGEGREEELQHALIPLLPRLVPRLYRARFDPTQAVRQAMEPVWKSVLAAAGVAEGDVEATGRGSERGGSGSGKKVVKKYLDPILDDLCEAAGSRKWRERQAAVAGLGELMPGRTFKEVRGRLERLWIIGFRALDDLKESVQMAGMDLAKGLLQMTGRLSNTQESPAAEVEEVVRVILPLLLSQGLPSKAKEVQGVAVLVLLRVVKGAGTCLRPYLPELMSALIEAQSAIEPAQLQYMQFHARSMDMTEEAMEVGGWGAARGERGRWFEGSQGACILLFS